MQVLGKVQLLKCHKRIEVQGSGASSLTFFGFSFSLSSSLLRLQPHESQSCAVESLPGPASTMFPMLLWCSEAEASTKGTNLTQLVLLEYTKNVPPLPVLSKERSSRNPLRSKDS